MVRLPLQKAQALDPTGDALNEQIDVNRREEALARRQQCYQIITNALYTLKGGVGLSGAQKEFGSSVRFPGTQPVLDQGSRDRYICQIVQLGVQWPDRAFHEYLYRKMIEIGLENELLEYGGSDLVPFLQRAGREQTQEVYFILIEYYLLASRVYLTFYDSHVLFFVPIHILISGPRICLCLYMRVQETC